MTGDANEPVRVGLVGAGQWARTMHAPLHAEGRETTLSGIWSPTGRGRDLAALHEVPVFGSFAELLDASEAVDFAVPPGAQADLAIAAAAAGKALMLEKPLGETVAQAEALVEAVELARVPTIVVLTKRYHQRTRDFVEACRALTTESPAIAITGRYVHGGLLPSGFIDDEARSGWRDALGVLYDLGPHLLDLVDLVAGPVVAIRATGDPHEAVTVETEHVSGAIGQLVLSARVATPRVLTDVDLYSNAGYEHYTTEGMDHDQVWPGIRHEFAQAVRHGSPVTVDVYRALKIQYLVDAAVQSLRESGSAVTVRRDRRG
ncbi:MAG: putative oxidoreductase [Glaciihabitans sp.]|nr:putative oxidoreductase [Glaciihabitans sp.]